MNSLTGRRILLGITGGIAAYKSADLARRLREAGAEVAVVMTRGAVEFISPLTLAAVSGKPVRLELFDADAEGAMGHIELARWAEVIIVAPASADFMARLAHGHADDLLSTLCLATTAPILLAPAMNQQMWLNSITQENAQRLSAHGIQLLGPAEGAQACGEQGFGRMVEPAELINYLTTWWTPQLLAGKSLLITAGATREMIDPVRYLSNRSSGKMGYALAAAAAAMGAKVTLVSGLVNLAAPSGVKRLLAQSAQDMQAAVFNEIGGQDIFIAAAAVADYRCALPALQKIKKTQATLTLQLERNPDILAAVSALPQRPFCVGFAAETENVIAHGKNKLRDKKVDLIIANQVGVDGAGFDSDNNTVTAIWTDGQHTLPLASKKQIAHDLLLLIADQHQRWRAK
jgi:phosphopantothenoylcysteine decarboxylase/phosphopantothenate--cysteine ligase